MRVAFYAPMKPADHPVPSGDREIARLLMRALAAGGHAVEVASRFCTRDGGGNAARQRRLRALGARLAARLVRRYLARPAHERPDAWLTYHVYHKSPDWLGPAVADALAIPYLIVEASSAPKRANGPWQVGYHGANAAIARADAVLSLNSDDTTCLAPLIARTAWHTRLAPFIETEVHAALAGERASIRNAFARRCKWNPDIPWLLTVGMMRAGDKTASYEILAEALYNLSDEPWHLLVAGGGPMRTEIVARLTAAAPGRIAILGELTRHDLAFVYAASDLFVWPAVNEAFGMALVEAQAAGLPVVAGNERGVPDIVLSAVTGLLPPARDSRAFADAIRRLIEDDALRAKFSLSAMQRARERFDISAAARDIDRALTAALLALRDRKVSGAA